MPNESVEFEMSVIFYAKLSSENSQGLDSKCLYRTYYDNVCEEYYILEKLDSGRVDHLYLKNKDIEYITLGQTHLLIKDFKGKVVEVLGE